MLSWILLTFGWNLLNSLNSRAKNSLSLSYNAATTLLTSAMYVSSILMVGNELLAAHGAVPAVLRAIAGYALASTVGSVAGQIVAVNWLEKRCHIQRG
jgi:hypothetical protein